MAQPKTHYRNGEHRPKEPIMNKSRLLAGALVAGAFFAGIVGGMPSSVEAQSVGSGQTGGSVAFVRDAGSAGHFEVQSAQLALERSQHIGVRGYAPQALKGATEMVNRVKSINEANVGAPMPSGPSDAQQATLNRLAGLSGSDFDREYMMAQVEVSDHLAKMFRDYGANGESPTLRLYAADAVTDYENQTARARTVAGSFQ
jgi:predicted outer membrane protein